MNWPGFSTHCWKEEKQCVKTWCSQNKAECFPCIHWSIYSCNKERCGRICSKQTTPSLPQGMEEELKIDKVVKEDLNFIHHSIERIYYWKPGIFNISFKHTLDNKRQKIIALRVWWWVPASPWNSNANSIFNPSVPPFLSLQVEDDCDKGQLRSQPSLKFCKTSVGAPITCQKQTKVPGWHMTTHGQWTSY